MIGSRIERHRYLILTVVLFAAVVLQIGSWKLAYIRESVLSILLVLVFFTVLDRRSHRFLALVAGVTIIAAIWTVRIVPDAERRVLELVVHVATVIFLFIAVGVILRRLLEGRTVTVDDILGALCGYLLAGVAFANIYGAIELLSPGAFAINTPISGLLVNWYERESLFVYYSLSTLTTMGYGDITPVAPAARSTAVIEAVVGQFYLAVVVAQLVGARLTEATGGETR